MAPTGHRWGGALLPADTHGHLSARKSAVPSTVNLSLHVPPVLRRYYDQDGTGMCVAFSICQAHSLDNGRLYDPAWLFARADGTSSGVSATRCCEILRDRGEVVGSGEHAPLTDSPGAVPSIDDRLASFAYIPNDRDNPRSTLDQARAVIASGRPFLMLFAYYEHWVDVHDTGVAWIGPEHANDDWGQPTVGHQWVVTGAHDDGAYFESPNSWGPDQPMFRMRYATFEGVIARGNGYALVLNDDVTGTETSLDPPAPPPPPPAPVVFVCPVCRREFPTERKRNRHLRRRHGR